MRPATKTVITASTSSPYRPEPVPPGAISPSIMSKSATPPPSAVSESCALLTAPVEVRVVPEANSAVAAMPKRTSFPSIAAWAAWGAVPWCWYSKKVSRAPEATQKTVITATIA